MKAQSIFLTTIFILLFFNIFLWSANQNDFFNDLLGGIIGLIIAATTTAVISGLNILGSGLSSSSIRILFGVIVLCMLLFQIPIPSLPIGLGLANNILTCFSSSSVFSFFGLILSLSLTSLALLGGLIIIVGGYGD